MECFKVYRNEISGRLDCHFYRPEYTKLDRKIKSISNKKIGDYIISISGGATPDIKQSEKYYTDADKGIPFLRVQNVTPEGLNIDDVKYINEETHDGLLKRSQVKEFNLLTKITGVGRMAVSSVAPKGFIGNINQHLVVVETESEKVSKVLATFLNSDVGEKLATKRSTGGTRPALDFKALKSIPIIFKSEIVESMDNAYNLKKQKETEAKQLLDSINDYVLSELGITQPPDEKKTCYSIYSIDIEGRIDPSPYHPKRINAIKTIKSLKHKKYSLKNFVKFKREIITSNNQDVPYIGLENIGSNTGLFIPSKEIKESFGSAFQFNNGDILFPKLRPYLNKVYLAEFDGVCSTEFHVLESKRCNNIYLSAFLRSKIVVNQTSYLMTGNTLPRLQTIDVENLLIPVPSDETQNKIAEEIKARMQKAEQLRKEAKEVLKEAKERVERIILGEVEIEG